MKTLEEIISRQDYVRMNNALIARAHEVAVIIRDKMQQIDMKVSHSAPCIALNEIIGYRNGEPFSCGLSLCYRVKKTDPDELECCRYFGKPLFNYYSLDEKTSWNESVNNEANSQMLLYFLNNVRNILNEIDKVESEKVADIENAINSVSNI